MQFDVIISAQDLPEAVRPAFDYRTLFDSVPTVTMSDEHSRASFHQPVLLWQGEAYGPGDLSPDTVLLVGRSVPQETVDWLRGGGWTVRVRPPMDAGEYDTPALAE